MLYEVIDAKPCLFRVAMIILDDAFVLLKNYHKVDCQMKK